MRKKVKLLCLLLLFVFITGCGNSDNIKVYNNTEESGSEHEEKSLTAVVTKLDKEQKQLEFTDCYTGKRYELIYNGGVSVYNSYDRDVGVGGLYCGCIVDIVYYSDTSTLVSISFNKDVVTLDGVTKLAVDVENMKALCRGKSYSLSDASVAFEGDKSLNLMEINTEDKVCMNVLGGVLVSVILQEGHGYVSFHNHESYIGGMVEIGKDVIVPVTADMLVTVREGTYTLRISKDGYSSSKEVTVIRGEETKLDLTSIAVPDGTVTFNVTPSWAKIYINGKSYGSRVFTSRYGTYNLKIEADGYKTFSGGFKIADPVKTYSIELAKLESATTEDGNTGQTTTQTDTGSGDASTTEQTATDTDATSATTGGDSTTDSDTEEPTTEHKTKNVIKINKPVGVGVYLDGEYMGIAPVSFAKTVGTHTVTLYKIGYFIKSYTIQSTDNGKDDEYEFSELTSVLDMNE